MLKVKDILSDESKWTKGVSARDINRKEVDISNDNAVCFCLVGAMLKISIENNISFCDMVIKVNEEVSPCSVGEWNDDPNRTFQEVRQLIEKLDI